MHTLQEFFYQTKSVEYLLGALFLISFIYFYRFLIDGADIKTDNH